MPMTEGPAGPVHWSDLGTGEPVVLLHGLGGDVSFWDAEQRALSDAFRVLAIDLRGSGRTQASAVGASMDDLADDVAAVLSDQGIDSAHIVGFSMGGLVAQAFAARHPHATDRLVLAATYPTINAQSRLFLDAVLDVYSKGATPRQMFNLICPWLFSIDFLSRPANSVYLQYPEDDPFEQTLDEWRALYLAQRSFHTDALPVITAPTLVLAGSEDRLVSTRDAEQLASAIPGARTRTLPGGHLFNIESHEGFLDAVRGHLTRDAVRTPGSRSPHVRPDPAR
ncbi:alpha/beta fold hydrolase [Streptomyces sp. NPDC090303]|uniref:alpha/beta fold hydrolase n=1 Tax=Streptomyces sp. NPDC090303 TaxID=3365960 RepID=UPI00380D5577